MSTLPLQVAEERTREGDGPRRRTNGGVATAPSVGDALRRIADGVQRLVREHLALARTELRQELRVAGRSAALLLAGLPLLLVGWALLMGSLALALSGLLGLAGSLALVGAVNLLVGGILALVSAKRLAGADRPDLEITTRELKEDRRWLQKLSALVVSRS